MIYLAGNEPETTRIVRGDANQSATGICCLKVNFFTVTC